MIVIGDFPKANPCFADTSRAPFLQDPTATEAADALLAAYLGFIKDYRKTKTENKNN